MERSLRERKWLPTLRIQLFQKKTFDVLVFQLVYYSNNSNFYKPKHWFKEVGIHLDFGKFFLGLNVRSTHAHAMDIHNHITWTQPCTAQCFDIV